MTDNQYIIANADSNIIIWAAIIILAAIGLRSLYRAWTSLQLAKDDLHEVQLEYEAHVQLGIELEQASIED